MRWERERPIPPRRRTISPQERASMVQTYEFPPGPMASALNSFADANGLHLLYDASVTQRLKTPGLSGSFSAQEGLDHLLVGTGLSYRIGPTGHTVSIILAQNNNGTRTDAAPAGAEQLPTIDVGAAQPVQAGPGGEGQGTGPGLAATGNGTGPGGYGGAGAAQDPYNKSYVLEKASTATKTNTPVMETPVNVQSVSQQVLQDQQATNLVDGVAECQRSFPLSQAVRAGLRVSWQCKQRDLVARVCDIELLPRRISD